MTTEELSKESIKGVQGAKCYYRTKSCGRKWAQL